MIRKEFYNYDILKNMKSNKLFDLGRIYTKSVEELKYLPLEYKLDNKYEEYNLGRLYCNQKYDKFSQNHLISNEYVQIKIQNLYVLSIIEIANEHKIKMSIISGYLNNVNDFLSKLNSDKKIAKLLFKKALCGGFTTLAEIKMEPVVENDFYKSIVKEINNLSLKVYDTYKNKYDEMLKKNDHNKKLTLLTLLVQTKEREAILELIKYVENTLKIHVGRIFHNKIFVENKKFILKYDKFTLIQKPIESNYEFIETDTKSSDHLATIKFIELMGDNLQVHNNTPYFYYEGIYTSNYNVYETYLLKFGTRMEIKGKDYVGSFANNKLLYKSLMGKLMFMKEKHKFMKNNKNNGIGKLLFKDGIYDIKEKIFTPGYNKNIVFFNKIDYNFPGRPSEDKIKFVRKVFFEDGFCETLQDFGTYLLKAFTMAIYGDYLRKKIYFLKGPVNCGKSLFCDFIKYVFEDYVEDFSAENLLYRPGIEDDYALSLYWLKDIHEKRIAFSNECKNNKHGYDNELIKKITTDSDFVKVRGPHEAKPTSIQNQSTLFVVGNKDMKVKEVDDAIIYRVDCIEEQYSFKSVLVDYYDKKKDPDLKNKLHNEEHRAAFLYLIMDCYNMMEDGEKCINGDLIKPQCLIENNFQTIVKTDPFEEFLEDHYNNLS